MPKVNGTWAQTFVEYCEGKYKYNGDEICMYLTDFWWVDASAVKTHRQTSPHEPEYP